MEELSKEKRIEAELNRLTVLFQEIDANQRSIVSPLIQNAAFEKVTLEDLQEQINTEGVTEIYTNGANQQGVKQSAALQSYVSLMKTYAAVIKTLAQLVPPEKRAKISPVPVITLEEKKREDDDCIERAVRINAEIAKKAEEQRQKREAEAKKTASLSFGG